MRKPTPRPGGPIPDIEREFIDAIASGRLKGDVTILDEDGNPVERLIYSSIPGRAPSLQKAPSLDRPMIDAIEAGLTEGDDLVVEIGPDSARFEVLPDGRRIPMTEESATEG